ncbi:MAG: DUF3099 domain-containing protein [Flaviflexus sp.]|nr:DUF3099 domain-containing protein [Flaviflexus sp.]
MRKKASEVVSITSVRRALSEDVEARSRRYLFSMIVRMICLVSMLIVPNWPARVALACGAVVIPAIAVLVANAGREKPTPPQTVDYSPHNLPAIATSTPRFTIGDGEYLR